MNIDPTKWYVIKPTGNGQFELHNQAQPKPSYSEAVQVAESQGWTAGAVICGEQLLEMGYDG